MAKDFDITKLLDLTRESKYATTVAAFEAIDLLEQINVPRKYRSRKPAIQALYALSDGLIRYDYISDEQRTALDEELKSSKARLALNNMFKSADSIAPAVAEEEGDLEEIGETEPEKALEDSEFDEFDREEEETASREEEEEEESEDLDSDDEEEEEE
ncbi:MAG: hypothetical protein HS115_03805 [Spirochaetales bacterium]|nr:hypothetical protein [Spirochaetales bacterium]